jgi:hypothetical protein
VQTEAKVIKSEAKVEYSNNIKITTQRIKIDNVPKEKEEIPRPFIKPETKPAQEVNYNEIYKTQKKYARLLVIYFNLGNNFNY